MRRTLRTLASALAIGLVAATGCGRSEEGESCDRANGNDDCAAGLVCRAGFEVKAGDSVCCPRPPAKPSTNACQPAVSTFDPDPSVDAAVASGGSGGTGGSAGQAGAAGSGGVSGADAGTDASADAEADAEAGASDAASDVSGD
ncbi:MAG: hypothetical protein KC776_29060 [Myxococcales bacterium]|nr:hypothetical protein [Myxococcales bacterium]MCB9580923.1 hypothetical protein [Polyangiaceae bacterium]